MLITECKNVHVPFLILIFPDRVDKDRSGAISSDELQQALSNGLSIYTIMVL